MKPASRFWQFKKDFSLRKESLRGNHSLPHLRAKFYLPGIISIESCIRRMTPGNYAHQFYSQFFQIHLVSLFCSKEVQKKVRHLSCFLKKVFKLKSPMREIPEIPKSKGRLPKSQKSRPNQNQLFLWNK